MVRLLFLIIIAAITLPFVFFQLKSISSNKKIIIAGGSFVAATSGVLMQFSFPLYYSILIMVAISLLAALVFMKFLEKEKEEVARSAEERKMRKQQMQQFSPDFTNEKTNTAPASGKVTAFKEESKTVQEFEVTEESEPVKELVGASLFSMESIQPAGKEDQRGQ